MKDFSADLAQWPLCCVVLGRSLNLSKITLQVGRARQSRNKGDRGFHGRQERIEGVGADDLEGMVIVLS